jgi:hypothetical protein
VIQVRVQKHGQALGIVCRGLCFHAEEVRLIPAVQGVPMEAYATSGGWRMVATKKYGPVWFCPSCAKALGMVA